MAYGSPPLSHPRPADALAKMLRTKLRRAEYIAGPENGACFFQLASGSEDPIWLVQNGAQNLDGAAVERLLANVRPFWRRGHARPR